MEFDEHVIMVGEGRLASRIWIGNLSKFQPSFCEFQPLHFVKFMHLIRQLKLGHSSLLTALLSFLSFIAGPIQQGTPRYWNAVVTWLSP